MKIDNAGVGIEVADSGTGTPGGAPARLPRHGTHVAPPGGGAQRRRVSHDRPGPTWLRSLGRARRPRGYNLAFLAADVLAVLDHLGVERAHVVGHDWGAALPGRWPRSPLTGSTTSLRFRWATPGLRARRPRTA